jgi:ribonuclease HII
MYIIGVDEVGIGPAFGPVVACAYSPLPQYLDELTELLEWGATKGRDSKQRSHTQRSTLLPLLKKYGHYKISVGTVREINTINICQASLLAMKRAVDEVSRVIKPDRIMVDGKNLIPGIERQTVIKEGDTKVMAIAAASILAKEFRDSFICHLATWPQFDKYGLAQHKGYTTSPRKGLPGLHEEAIARWGKSPLHHINNKAVIRAQAKFLGTDSSSLLAASLENQPKQEGNSQLCLQLQQLNLF